MKFLFILIFVSINICSQNTYVPDDNFEQLLIDFGYDSGPLDDFVPTNNINSVTELFIDDSSIKNFVGIDGFTALTRLSIEIYEVTELDISKNIKLKDLSVSNGSLKNIDLSKNTELETLRLVVVDISSIDLKNNLKLKDLTIGNTVITKIDLRYNEKLLDINLSHGIIENINLKNNNNTNINTFFCSNNSELKCLQVDNKSYSITNWTDIDDNTVYSDNCSVFKNLTYVPDDNFEQKLIDLGYDSGSLDNYVPTANINTIKNLNITNENISDLTGIQDFISLEDLQFTQNNVSNIDLSSLINLKTLYSNNNNILSIDVSNNINLIDLFTGYNPLTKIDVSKNLNLEQLDISNTNVSTIELSKNKKLTLFSSSNTNISALNTSNNLNLTYLHLSFNKISELDLTINDKLFELNCSNNPLTKLSLPPNNILDGLHVNSTLISELDLRNQANLISNAASFLEIQDNVNLKCVYVDDVSYYNSDPMGSITKDAQSTFVLNEAECAKLDCKIDVDTLNDVNECNSFELPNLTNGSFYTQSNGNGTKLNAGDFLYNSQTIYIYNEDPSNNACFNETSFKVIITQKPLVDNLSDVTINNNYLLPELTNGNYYTQSNGNGTKLNAGDFLNTSQTVYIYNEDSSNAACSNETSFKVNINSDLEIPNYFTPNNDGLNDFWVIQNNSQINEILIYDRFGKLIAKPNISIGWNGNINGKLSIPNSYWYLITLKNGKKYKGSFSLIK
ncbi:T9SS type B sorting domain-containing protein [Polaribacter sp. KT 15]|uniref:T9SS type B sorting domain-containing protein n=1 Tax=Polaribacter sp. KT 15 TaxID=1896175 RepID=UPI0015618360|nr:T9SS type B sorting domain-containing protein [Polaribacter sp. KT 15]